VRWPISVGVGCNSLTRQVTPALFACMLSLYIRQPLPAQTTSQSGAQAPTQQPAKPGASSDGKQTPDQQPAAPKTGQEADADHSPPGVTGGTPTITDTATLSPPGWLECDPGSLKNLNRDRILGTPILLKLTSGNRRLQYRLATDGYIREGDGADGIGDTYLGLHYLLGAQEKVGFDVAGRITVKIPTSRPALGGTNKFDYNGLMLASRDFTKWGFHGDFNIGLASLTRPSAPGTDTQYLLAASTTSPIRGGRWQYTNELVYFSPILGQSGRLTTMHGFAYSVHRYEVYSAALQWQLHGDGATLQVLVAGSFFLSKLF
jgi:hypothetical protein